MYRIAHYLCISYHITTLLGILKLELHGIDILGLFSGYDRSEVNDCVKREGLHLRLSVLHLRTRRGGRFFSRIGIVRAVSVTDKHIELHEAVYR